MFLNGSFFKRRALLLFCVSCLCLIPLSSDASDGKEKLFEESFERMLADPSDVDLTLAYANAAIDVGNYEAAIPPLERMLFFNPELYEIKFQLGVMYYNLKSYDVAREYFVDAKSGDSGSDIASRADEYLKKIGG